MRKTVVLVLSVVFCGCLADGPVLERSHGQALCFKVNDMELGIGFLGPACADQGDDCRRRGSSPHADRLGLQYGGFYDGGGCRERAGYDRHGRPNWESPRSRGGGAYGWDGNWYPQNEGYAGGGYYDCGGTGCGYVDRYGDARRNSRQSLNAGAGGQRDAYYDSNGYRNEPGWYHDDRGRRQPDRRTDCWVDGSGNSYYSYSGEGTGGWYDDGRGYEDNPYWY